jgi:hypothetical protein
LEREIQQKEQSDRSNIMPAAPDLSGNIGRSPRNIVNNKVGLEYDFDTLDEPIIDTIVGHI